MLNQTLNDVANHFLRDAGHQAKIAVIDQGDEIETEIENYLWADVAVY